MKTHLDYNLFHQNILQMMCHLLMPARALQKKDGSFLSKYNDFLGIFHPYHLLNDGHQNQVRDTMPPFYRCIFAVYYNWYHGSLPQKYNRCPKLLLVNCLSPLQAIPLVDQYEPELQFRRSQLSH